MSPRTRSASGFSAFGLQRRRARGQSRSSLPIDSEDSRLSLPALAANRIEMPRPAFGPSSPAIQSRKTCSKQHRTTASDVGLLQHLGVPSGIQSAQKPPLSHAQPLSRAAQKQLPGRPMQPNELARRGARSTPCAPFARATTSAAAQRRIPSAPLPRRAREPPRRRCPTMSWYGAISSRAPCEIAN